MEVFCLIIIENKNMKYLVRRWIDEELSKMIDVKIIKFICCLLNRDIFI